MANTGKESRILFFISIFSISKGVDDYRYKAKKEGRYISYLPSIIIDTVKTVNFYLSNKSHLIISGWILGHIKKHYYI